MSSLIQVEPIALLPAPGGCPLFLGTDHKCILLYIDPTVGASINQFLTKESLPRPLSHDLFSAILESLGAEILHTTIVDVQEDTFFARLYIKAENEVMEKKVIEIDSRPSDAIALALRHEAPIFILPKLWNQLEDAGGFLEQLRAENDFPSLP